MGVITKKPQKLSAHLQSVQTTCLKLSCIHTMYKQLVGIICNTSEKFNRSVVIKTISTGYLHKLFGLNEKILILSLILIKNNFNKNTIGYENCIIKA